MRQHLLLDAARTDSTTQKGRGRKRPTRTYSTDSSGGAAFASATRVQPALALDAVRRERPVDEASAL